MPAKGSISQFHGRYSIINKKLWAKYIKETGEDVSYEDFKLILAATMEEIKSWILREPIGFQIPELGNIAVNRFKTNSDFKSYIGSTPIRNYNLHTGGNAFKIQWFHSSTVLRGRIPFWFFKASRAFNRSLAVVLKANNSPSYNSFMQDHFIQKAEKQCKS